MNIQSFGTAKIPIFQTPTSESQGKVTFGCSFYGEIHSIL
jgi:hypothetical protein